MPRRAGWLGFTLLVAASLGALAWRYGSAGLLALALAVPAATPWLDPLGEPPRREEIAIPLPMGRLEADRYAPSRARDALLLVHGLSPSGRRQPDLERLARLLAAHGVLVVVPHFEGLAAFRLNGREVDDVRAALRYTATAAAGLRGSAGVAGFSFGAGPALIAAAGVPGLRVAASFGGYADLRHVIAYVTTGAHAFRGRHYRQRQEEYNRWKLLALLAPLVASGADRERLEEIARRKLADPGADASASEGALGDGGRAVLAVVINRREAAVEGLIAALPAGAQAALDALSPLAAVPGIRARLLLAHGLGDDSIPFTESLRLAEAAGPGARLALFETFHHTGPQAPWWSVLARARDGWSLLRVVDALLPR